MSAYLDEPETSEDEPIGHVKLPKMVLIDDLVAALEHAMAPLEVEDNAAHNAAVRMADVLLNFCTTSVFRRPND